MLNRNNNNNSKKETAKVVTELFLISAILLSFAVVGAMSQVMATSRASEEDSNNDDDNSGVQTEEDRANNNNDNSNNNNNKEKVKDNNDNDEEANQIGAELTITDNSDATGTPTNTKTAAVSTLSTANTDTLVPEYQRIVWTTTRTPTALLNMANNNIGTGNALDLDPGDQLVFHYGSGQAPTQAQIDALKQVDGITDNNIGFEFFSLAEIQQYAPVVASNGFGFIAYDLEAGASPTNETSNPVASFQSAKAAADAAGIELQAVPSRAITAANGAQIAPLVSLYHIQSQSLQDSDTTCATMKNFVTEREQALRSANNALNGKISFQVSFTAGAATGKTAYQTIVDCATATIPTPEDGISVWWNGAAFDNTGTDGLKAFYTFVENGYSRNNPN